MRRGAARVPTGGAAKDKVWHELDCPLAWGDMDGTRRTRRCRLCHRSIEEASDMARRTPKSLRARLRKRLTVQCETLPNGKVLTPDCGREVRRHFWRKLSCLTLCGAAITLWAWTFIWGVPRVRAAPDPDVVDSENDAIQAFQDAFKKGEESRARSAEKKVRSISTRVVNDPHLRDGEEAPPPFWDPSERQSVSPGIIP